MKYQAYGPDSMLYANECSRRTMTSKCGFLYTLLLMIVGIMTSLASSQTALLVQQKSAESNCSNIVALTGQVDIKCSSLTPAQQKVFLEMPVLLKKILTNQTDIKTEIEKIREMMKSVEASTTNISQDAVVGNVVNGSQNIVGNNDQINIGLIPSRHISPEWAVEGAKFLTSYSAKVHITYSQNDGEAYNYAMEIASMLKAAGWSDVGDPSGAMVFSSVPLYGVKISYLGDSLPPNSLIHLDMNKAWGRLAAVLYTVQGKNDLDLDPKPGRNEGDINITVFTNPKAKTQ
jgi:hypothetical protein